MASKLIESAQDWWRAVSAPYLVALVRTGAAFTGQAHRPTAQFNGFVVMNAEHNVHELAYF
jgi:hypothetical protein